MTSTFAFTAFLLVSLDHTGLTENSIKPMCSPTTTPPATPSNRIEAGMSGRPDVMNYRQDIGPKLSRLGLTGHAHALYGANGVRPVPSRLSRALGPPGPRLAHSDVAFVLLYRGLLPPNQASIDATAAAENMTPRSLRKPSLASSAAISRKDG
jgi:hypothetical protein